ncbi:hypothetical protein [Streptomyces sp. NRRL S-1868]|uniref:hypothetical protein n=1 Tax=Streptomyces sp. NRRL S-1868 TaxID=1463892 RepID=UPI0004C91D5A|nr:hypothetical protein [Streptomyces sp. NRRL S-1868]
MATTPIETREQHLAALRDVLTRALPLLSFAAGQLAAAHPESAEQLMSTADDVADLLARTA